MNRPLSTEPVSVGQTRRSPAGAVIVVHGVERDGRFLVSYPRLQDRSSVLSAKTIQDGYPWVLEARRW